MRIRVRLLRASDGRPMPRAVVRRYAYTGQSETTDPDGYVQFDDGGEPRSVFNTELAGSSPLGDRLTTPTSDEDDVVFVLDAARTHYEVRAPRVTGERLRVVDTRLVGPDLTPDGLLAGVEYLAELSYARTDPYASVRTVRDHGLNAMRVMSCLARWGADVGPTEADPIWFVSPWAHRTEWRANRDAWLRGLEDFGVYGVLCLFDKTNRPVSGGSSGHGVRAELQAQADAEGRGWKPENQGTTQGIATPSTADLVAKARELLDGVTADEHPHLIVQLVNEPSANPDQWSRVDLERLGSEIASLGFTPVSVDNWLGREGDVPGARHLIEDHQWGNGFPEEPDMDRLRELRTGNDAHVVWSSDGFSINDLAVDRIEEIGRELRAARFSFQGLVRMSPSRWDQWDPDRYPDIPTTPSEAARAIARSMTS